jgi:hypothetical protein
MSTFTETDAGIVVGGYAYLMKNTARDLGGKLIEGEMFEGKPKEEYLFPKGTDMKSLKEAFYMMTECAQIRIRHHGRRLPAWVCCPHATWLHYDDKSCVCDIHKDLTTTPTPETVGKALVARIEAAKEAEQPLETLKEKWNKYQILADQARREYDEAYSASCDANEAATFLRPLAKFWKTAQSL